MKSKYLFPIMAAALLSSCQDKDDSKDDPILIERAEISMDPSNLALVAGGDLSPLTYEEATKNLIQVTATISVEQMEDSKLTADDLGAIVQVSQLEGESPRSFPDSYKVSFEGDFLKVSIHPGLLPWDGGQYTLSFNPGDVGTHYTFAGQGSINFTAPEITRNFLNFSFDEAAATLKVANLALSKKQKLAISEAEGAWATIQALQGDLAKFGTRYGTSPDDEGETLEKLVAAVNAAATFAKCHQKDEGCEPESIEYTNDDALFSKFAEVSSKLQELEIQKEAIIYVEFPFTIENLSFQPAEGFAKPESFTIKSADGQDLSINYDALDLVSDAIQISYLFKSGDLLLPTTVPTAVYAAAPTSQVVSAFSKGQFKAQIHRAWVAEVFFQNPEKLEFLELSLPTDGVIDLAGGFSLQKSFQQRIRAE